MQVNQRPPVCAPAQPACCAFPHQQETSSKRNLHRSSPWTDNTPIQGRHPTRMDTLCTRQPPRITQLPTTIRLLYRQPTVCTTKVTSAFLPDDPHTPVCSNEMWNSRHACKLLHAVNTHGQDCRAHRTVAEGQTNRKHSGTPARLPEATGPAVLPRKLCCHENAMTDDGELPCASCCVPTQPNSRDSYELNKRL